MIAINYVRCQIHYCYHNNYYCNIVCIGTYIHITCILVVHTLLYRKYVNGIIILIGGRAICRLQIIITVDIVDERYYDL